MWYDYAFSAKTREGSALGEITVEEISAWTERNEEKESHQADSYSAAYLSRHNPEEFRKRSGINPYHDFYQDDSKQIDYTGIYGDSECYQEFMQKAVSAGANEEEAHEMFSELNYKYGNPS